PEQITHHNGDAVRNPTLARNGSRIAYEYNFEIWMTVLTRGTEDGGRRTDSGRSSSVLRPPSPVKIYAPADLKENLTEHVTLHNGASSLSLSPDGKTLAFPARGEIWTCPAEGGDATRLTKNGWAEYSPVWSADGAKLAYTTDRNGNLDVCLIDVKTKKEQLVTSDTADDVN